MAALLAGGLEDELLASAERDAHKLAGSLGMFGLPRSSELARALEQACPRGRAHGRAARVAALVAGLRNQLDRSPEEPRDQAGASAELKGRVLLLVSPDPQLVERLSAAALARALQPRSVATSAAARTLTAAAAPDAVVLDTGLAGEGDGLELLEYLASREPPVPALVLIGSEALVDRVEVARRGGRVLHRTRPASQVVDAVGEQLELRSPKKATILAVDDDPAVSAALVTLLAPGGLAVRTLNDPLRFWEALEDVGPDLLVLDLDMPQLDGIDLCRALRADVRFGQLPVVFLTARADAESVQRIFEAGADDYVSKPIVGPELVTRVSTGWTGSASTRTWPSGTA